MSKLQNEKVYDNDNEDTYIYGSFRPIIGDKR